MKITDITGIKFGKLTVIERRGSSEKDQQSLWLCKCECGSETIAKAYPLKNGKIKSCGCFKGGKGESRNYKNYIGEPFKYLIVISETDKIGESRAWLCECICGNKIIKTSGDLKRTKNGSCGCIPNGHKHGNSYAKYFIKYSVIRSRCYNINDKGYPNYGGRGITMCDEWLNNYHLFHKWVEDNYVKNKSIDRVDNDGPYAPWNCRFATPKQQANNRRSNVQITHNNMTKSISEWADYAGINRGTLRGRLIHGWPIEVALITKVKTYKNAN